MSKGLLFKFSIGLASLITSTVIYWNVSSVDSSAVNGVTSEDGALVLENIQIDYRYDKTKYEVVSLSTKPYAVVRGSKSALNRLKLFAETPTFYIDLNGKVPGTYKEILSYSGLDNNLTVEIYPYIQELRIMEQQTLKFIPQIELVNEEKVPTDLIVGVPQLHKDEVLVRDMQDRLNQIGSIRGTIDLNGVNKTKDYLVDLAVYDRDGEILEGVNLLEWSIGVTVPINDRVTIITEQVIQEIVVIENPIPTSSVGETTTTPSEPASPVLTTPAKQGVLSFVNIPDGFTLENRTPELVWSVDFKVDLKDFTEGIFEMSINDNGVIKVLKFSLVSETQVEDKTSGASEDSSDKDINND